MSQPPMSQPPINRIRLLALAGAVALVVIIAIALFSGNSNVGSLAVAATLARGDGITDLEFKVTGNGIAPIAGHVAVVSPGTASPISVKSIAAANGYVLELSAVSPDGKIKCNRRDTFDVELERTTTLELQVFCRDMTPIASFVATRKREAPKLAAVEPPTAPPIEVPPECSQCEKTHMASGNCESDAGCEGFQGEDKRLCLNLLNCMRATNCWVKDPLDCLCGTYSYEECTRTANGVCRAEMQAATKTTDPIQNGTLFYDPSVPASGANKLVACDRDMCKSHCSL